MLGQFVTVVIWTAFEYVLLRTFAAIAPAKCRAFLDGLFPTPRP